MFYYRLTLNDENRKKSGRRVIIISTARAIQPTDPIFAGTVCNTDGSPKERTIGGVDQRYVQYATRSDLQREPQEMTLDKNYGILKVKRRVNA